MSLICNPWPDPACPKHVLTCIATLPQAVRKRAASSGESMPRRKTQQLVGSKSAWVPDICAGRLTEPTAA